MSKPKTGAAPLHFTPATVDPGDALARITAMSEALRDAQARVATAAVVLAAAQKDQSRIELEDLPDLMKELRLKEIMLEDGSKVLLTEEVQCGITAANREAALEWLRANGYGGLIKTDLSLEFGKGEEEEARSLLGSIQKLTNRPVEIGEGVHHSTLKSFVKERREAGTQLPADLFSIHPFAKATLKAPKAAKVK